VVDAGVVEGEHGVGESAGVGRLNNVSLSLYSVELHPILVAGSIEVVGLGGAVRGDELGARAGVVVLIGIARR